MVSAAKPIAARSRPTAEVWTRDGMVPWDDPAHGRNSAMEHTSTQLNAKSLTVDLQLTNRWTRLTDLPFHFGRTPLLVNDHQRLIVLRRWDSIFYHEDKLRPSIRLLLRDYKAHENAQEILALIGDPQDLRLVVRLAPRSRRDPFSNRWAYRVACALLEPSTEEEWAFLRACALNDYDDRWVDAGAIQTLKLIASPRSLEILKEVQQRNPYRSKSLASAIDYIGSNPANPEGRKPRRVGR